MELAGALYRRFGRASQVGARAGSPEEPLAAKVPAESAFPALTGSWQAYAVYGSPPAWVVRAVMLRGGSFTLKLLTSGESACSPLGPKRKAGSASTASVSW